MNRKDGYYWVIEFKDTPCQIAFWDGNEFWICGCGDPYREEEFYSINETQILPPNN